MMRAERSPERIKRDQRNGAIAGGIGGVTGYALASNPKVRRAVRNMVRVKKSLVGHPLAGRKVFAPIKEFAEQERKAEKNPMLRSMNAAFGDTGLRLARRPGAYAAAKLKDPVSASFKGSTRKEWREHQIARDPFSAANKRRHSPELPTPLTERERAEAVLFVGTQGRKGSLPTHAVRKNVAGVKKSFVGGRYVKASALGRGEREALRRGGQMASQKAITRLENYDVHQNMKGVKDAIEQGKRMTPGDFTMQGIGGFALRTGGPSGGKSHTFFPPDASRNTIVHESAHAEPRRSMYRLHHQITNDPKRRMREEARADYLAGGHFMDAAKIKETKPKIFGRGDRTVERKNNEQSGYGDAAYRLRREEQTGKKGAFDDMAHSQIGRYASSATSQPKEGYVAEGKRVTREYQNLHGKMKAAGTKVRKSMTDKKAWHSIDQSERLASQNRRKRSNAARNGFGVAGLAATGAAVFPKDTVDAISQFKLLGRLSMDHKDYGKLPRGTLRIARSNPVGTAVLAGGVGAAGLGAKSIYHGAKAKEHQARADRRRKANYDRKRVAKAWKDQSPRKRATVMGAAGGAVTGALGATIYGGPRDGLYGAAGGAALGGATGNLMLRKGKKSSIYKAYKPFSPLNTIGDPEATKKRVKLMQQGTNKGVTMISSAVNKSDIEMVRDREGKFMGRRYVAPAMLDTAIAFDNEDLVEKASSADLRAQRNAEQKKGNSYMGAGAIGGSAATLIPYSNSAGRLIRGVQADHKSLKHFAQHGDVKGARKGLGYARGVGRSLKFRVPRSPLGAGLFAAGTASIPLTVQGVKHTNEAQRLNGQALKAGRAERAARKAEVAKYSFGPNPTHLKPGVVSSVTRRVDSGKRRIAETVDTVGRKDNPFFTPKRTTTTRQETFPEGRPGTKKYQPRTVTSSSSTTGRKIKPLGGAVIGAGGAGAGAGGGYAAGRKRNDVTKAMPAAPKPPQQQNGLNAGQKAGLAVGSVGLAGGTGLTGAAGVKTLMARKTGGGQGAKMFRQAGKLQKAGNRSALVGGAAFGATAGLSALRQRQQGGVAKAFRREDARTAALGAGAGTVGLSSLAAGGIGMGMRNGAKMAEAVGGFDDEIKTFRRVGRTATKVGLAGGAVTAGLAGGAVLSHKRRNVRKGMPDMNDVHIEGVLRPLNKIKRKR